MVRNRYLKERAIELRKQGLTYSEILERIKVAKSTLSSWLHSVGLAKHIQQRITEKKRLAALRGALARKNTRIALTQRIFREARSDVSNITDRELWLMGIMLYWAEGSKEKDHNPGSGVQFSNSDPGMIRLFLIWLLGVCKVQKNQIVFEIYIHENSKNDVSKARYYWAQATGFPVQSFNRVYFKRNKIRTNRKNTGNLYFGLLRVRVRASSTLNRKIAGWVHAICEDYRVV